MKLAGLQSNILLLAILTISLPLFAGGPRWVAGASYFDVSAKGVPITWTNGTIRYFTDRGNLSPLLPNASAKAFVADAFSRWTSVPTAAVAAISAGDLDEDVDGDNLTRSDQGIIMPTDILETATSKPVAIVYDEDGRVIEALVGQGASSSCFDNSVVEKSLTFGPDGHFTHALLILNGKCAATTSQLADMKYQLVRAVGRIFGLGWSQIGGDPTLGDPSGLSILHEKDPANCVPISSCYGAGADQPKIDDRASLSRLYPVTSDNIGNFPGKRLFFENAYRIHGSVYFVDANGKPAKRMQGVNVVAHWIDPVSRKTSGTFVASSVSGFLFCGNAGNPVTGFTDSLGERFDRFGSDELSLESFYDLTGIETGVGGISQEFQISVEPLDPTWSPGVGPYPGFSVWPSGRSNLIAIRPTRGRDFSLDIVMQLSAPQVEDWFGEQSFASPANLPASGDWIGSLSNYGTAHFFRLPGRSNRTVAVEVTALDEKGAVTESKARPVIGVWTMRDSLTPAQVSTPFAFNTGAFGVSRLDEVELLENTDFRIGIADYRGDGRPDFRYHARILYGDLAVPSRIGVSGGTALTIHGLGFRPNTQIQIGGITSSLLGMSAATMITRAPVQSDGVKDIVLTDPVSGASSVMKDALILGAGPGDRIQAVSVGNPPVAVGQDSPNAIRARVIAADGVTPVSGASVMWQSVPAANLSACGGDATCTVVTDQSGMVSTRAALRSKSPVTITAQLAPASYSPAKQVHATLAPAASAALNLVLSSESIWIAQGATVDLPVTVRALSAGTPQAGIALNLIVPKGEIGLSASSAVTDSSGNATLTLHLAALNTEAQFTACAAPGNAPCSHLLRIIPVTPSSLRLQPVSGNLQSVLADEPIPPLVVRVTDSSISPNPVTAATVALRVVLTQPRPDVPPIVIGDVNIHQDPGTVVLGSYQLTAISDIGGLARFQIPRPAFPEVVMEGSASAGIASLALQMRFLPQMAVQVAPARPVSATAMARATPRIIGVKTPSMKARLQSPGGVGRVPASEGGPSLPPGGTIFLPVRGSGIPADNASDSCRSECSECSDEPRCRDREHPAEARPRD
jgi:hypothetical protein